MKHLARISAVVRGSSAEQRRRRSMRRRPEWYADLVKDISTAEKHNVRMQESQAFREVVQEAAVFANCQGSLQESAGWLQRLRNWIRARFS